ncbi:hypothetical protein [Endozoicomonas sp. SCSIO W0465]|uniref:hypothetical protein n=1 Tax=Endozoicomonas sp. SCSIO W0465 TaxID=2918516 RepID=UPI00207613C3|nr:hypothetical protein [Endozoicomonas sp. SCSIO W0465]USE39266.1 hypothetical protein MJO57_14535 [Endozoicomonas sp. SCSIO W0465]
MLANIVEKWCLRGWYKNQKIPDLCGGAEQLRKTYGSGFTIIVEPPGADPHAGCCGEGWRKTGPYPI